MGRVEIFLNRLVEYGEKTSFLVKKQLKNLDKSCCQNAVTEVYDFDDCKTFIAKEHDLKSPKSCDALKIIAGKSIIDFIELKGWKEFVRWQLDGTNDKEKIEKQIEKFQMGSKITDSLYVLYTLMKRGDFGLTNEERDLYFREVEKKYIIVVDLDLNNPRQIIATSLGVRATKTNVLESLIENTLRQEIDDIPIDSLSDPKKSILKTCVNIDAFYVN